MEGPGHACAARVMREGGPRAAGLSPCVPFHPSPLPLPHLFVSVVVPLYFEYFKLFSLLYPFLVFFYRGLLQGFRKVERTGLK